MASGEERLRPSARALLVDPERSILLAEFVLPHLHLWATPGGGIEPGESSLDALRRELVEEVGLPLPDDPPLVWRRTVVVEGIVDGYDGVLEDFYLVPVERFDPRGALSDQELAAEHLVSFRWWTIEEIRSATAAKQAYFSPRHLGDLLDDLLTAGPPDRPIELGL